MVLEYLKLFVTFAKIGMFTIGGGYAMIPLIEREIVNKQWMNKEEFMEMFALTQSLPGVFAVNISIFVGYKLYKVGGIGEAYDSIKAGKLDATVDSFGYYMSQVATEVTLRILDGQDIPRVVHTPQALIDSSNVNEDAAQIIGWKDPTYVAK